MALLPSSPKEVFMVLLSAGGSFYWNCEIKTSPPPPPLKGYLGTTSTNGESGRSRKAAPSDPAGNGLTLIFPEHTTNAAPIKSLLFTVTFFFPSFLGEIFPPLPGISVTGYPLQNKRPSSAVTQSQYGRLVRFWACHTVTSVLLLFTYSIYRWEKATWDKTWWLITALPPLTYS